MFIAAVRSQCHPRVKLSPPSNPVRTQTFSGLGRPTALALWIREPPYFTPPHQPLPSHPRLLSRQMGPGDLQRALPAWFVRGGTSNGLVVHRDDLPPEREWHQALPAAMGSPDSYCRQLNGMGSGVSSTSKVVVLGPPSRPDVDVDYTFVQVGIKDGSLDLAGNCGNMSSMVGPVAWDKGLISTPNIDLDGEDNRWATVRFLNTNTNKVMSARFKISGEPAMYCPTGDYEMDGVPGKSSKITMSFLDPAGAKTGKALPTGYPIDSLRLPDGSAIEASLVDVGNPGVFVDARSLGMGSGANGAAGPADPSNGAEPFAALTPPMVESDTSLKDRLEQIRRAGAQSMGLDPNVESIPKIVLLFPSVESTSVDIRCLAMSMGQAHRAVPLTLALCLGAASQMQGTIACNLVHGREKQVITIGHPSGTVDIGTVMENGRITAAHLLRTGRVLMKGDVYY